MEIEDRTFHPQPGSADKHSRRWYCFALNRQSHSLTELEVSWKLASGELGRDCHVWSEGMSDWESVTEHPSFATAAMSAPEETPVAFLHEIDQEPISFVKTEETPTTKALLSSDQMDSAFSSYGIDTQALAQRMTSILANSALYTSPTAFEIPSRAASRSTRVSADSMIERIRALSLRTKALAAIMTIFVVAVVPILFSASALDRLGDIDQGDRERLKAAMSQWKWKTGVVSEIALSSKNPFEPTFYIGTNLPTGSKVKVVATGVKGTLLGAIRAESSSSVVIESGLGTTGAFHLSNGQRLPQGEYKVVAICESCSEASKLLERSIFLGGERNELYARALIDHQKKLAEQAKMEIVEIRELIDTTENQLIETTKGFLASSKNGASGRKSWKKLSNGWKALDFQLGAMFLQWTPEVLERDMYHDRLFSSLKAVGLELSALHLAQDTYVMQDARPETAAAELSARATKIQRDLIDLRAQLSVLERSDF